MGIGKNTVRRVIATKAIISDIRGKLASTAEIAQGDLVVWDDTNNRVILPAAEAEGATFLGVMAISVQDGVPVGPYTGLTDVDAAVAQGAIQGPQFGDVHAVILKTGDTVAPGDLVYLDPATGSRGVAATGTKAIGVYQGAGSVTGDGVKEIEVLIGARFPGDALRF